VCRLPIDGGLLLLDRASNCLFAYNDTARHVWDLIQESHADESLISEFARVWAIPRSRAHADINAIVAEWRAQSVLVDCSQARRHPASLKPRSVGSAWGELEAGWWSEWVCTIRGTPIAFAVETEIPGPFRSLFAHLETPNAIPQARLEIRTDTHG
jgi:Coenzyme PQQ synthesis protein D (PqqD)